MLKKLLSTVLFMLVVASISKAQTGSIEGTVIDKETGETVPAANVVLMEIQRGASTDSDGNYSISNVPVGEYTLRISFVGYETYTEQVEILANQTITKDVQLTPGSIGLDEVVVTGYGTQTKRELTGSIASVSSEDFEDVPVQNAGGILQGRAAGVQVTTTSGTPGAGFNVRVRGSGSINAGSQPLYIVDGVQLSFSNQNGTNDNTPLNAIAPENIESIEVLKDAAAAAIYGSQAANGVVLITTKRGKAGQTRVSASVERGVTERINNIDYFNRDQFIEFFTAAFKYDFPGLSDQVYENAFRQNFLPSYGFDPATPYSELPDTDWFKFNSRQGVSANYNVTVSGGSEASRYRISAEYEDTDGYIKENNFQNYSINGNFDQELSSKFSTAMNVNISSQKFVGPCQDGFFINCPISQAAFSAPLARPYNDDGSYSQDFPLIGSSNNPAIQFNERERRTDVLQILGSISGTYDFMPWLSLRSQLSMDYRKEDERIFSNNIANPAENGSLTQISAPTSNFQFSSVLNFNRSFSEVHNVSGLLGIEYRRDYTSQIAAAGIGFPNPLFNQLNSAAEPTTAAGFTNEFRRAGYFTNLKYNYDEKYFVNFTARYDGSSKFGANKRFGFFPAVSAAWTISEEDFFQSDVVEQLKIRVSYGKTGNSADIGRYAARGLYGTAGSYNGTTGLRPSQLANRNLTWEESTTADIGIDFSLWAGRVTGAFDVYRKTNSDLLLNRPLPNDSGFGSITRNVGEVQNDGIEFEFRSVNIRTNDFQWSTNFNIGINRNEVTSLAEGQDALFPSNTQPIAVGHSLDAWKVVRYAGVNPADGRPFWYDKDGNLTYDPDTIDDRVFYDGGEEDAVGGIGTTLQYKGLSLRAFFQYSYGQTALPQQVVAFGINQVGGSQTNGIVPRLTDAWRNPGDVKPFPAPTLAFTYPNSGAGYFLTATDKLYDASYIRLKNVTLSYTLPTSITEAAKLGNVQLYVTGLNLVTWTSYIGFDPEVAGSITQASIPVGRTVNAGIKVQF